MLVFGVIRGLYRCCWKTTVQQFVCPEFLFVSFVSSLYSIFVASRSSLRLLVVVKLNTFVCVSLRRVATRSRVSSSKFDRAGAATQQRGASGKAFGPIPMGFSRLAKPLRRSYTSMVAGVAATMGLGQMLYLKATYASPPDAFGPREGIERHIVGVEEPPGVFSATATETSGVAAVAGERHVNASEQREEKLDDATRADLPGAAAAVASSFVSRGVLDSAAANSDGAKRPRILVIGDSLVSGVGGEASWINGPKDGPPLPRHVARYLSQKWNADVQWNAMSLTGGDVRMLRRKILPMLKRERENKDTCQDVTDVTAVVLVTGVNDWKRMSPSRTPSKFRADLQEFITRIREIIGEECHIFLPAIPGVHHAPRFHDPLRSFLILINDQWDAQKLALARAMKNVHFVGNPPEAAWTARPAQFFCTQDRLHPSELGYTRWGERIANQIVSVTDKGRAAIIGRRVNVAGAKVVAAASAVAKLESEVASSPVVASAATAAATAAASAAASAAAASRMSP